MSNDWKTALSLCRYKDGILFVQREGVPLIFRIPQSAWKIFVRFVVVSPSCDRWR